MHFTHDANHGEQFLQYIVTGDATFVHHMTLKTSTVSLMWKQTLSTTETEFKAMPLVRESELSVFNHTGLFMDLLVMTL